MPDLEPVLIYRGHSDNVFALAWSPDGRYLASAGRDRVARIWQALSGEDVLVYHRHTSPLLSLAWSPAGTRLASGDTAGEVHVWRAEDGECVTLYHGHRRFVRGVAWSPAGALLASGGDFGDSTVQIWRPENGQELAKHDEQYRIFVVVWSPDGQRLAACSFDGRVQVWNACNDDGLCIPTGNTDSQLFTYTGHTGPVYALSWSPDDSALASAGQDGQIHVWEDLSGKLLYTSSAHSQAVKALAWSPDGSAIASGGNDALLRVWRPSTDQDALAYTGHTSWIRALCWSPDGRYLASASGRTVHVVPARFS